MNKQERLIQEIKGIRRVVINKCYGGFSLSHDAVLRYLELCGLDVWPEDNKFSRLTGPTYWLVPPEADRAPSETPEEWAAMTMAERAAHNQKWDQQTFYPRDIARDDPFLVQVVTELGTAANGHHAELKVVEVPADVDWEIDEYDGNEWVAEKHRTWS